MKPLIVSLFIVSLLAAAGCCSTTTAGAKAPKVVILKATYGVGTNTVDVTEEIRMLAKSGSIHLHPQWGLGVDPAFGKIKRLTVAYRYKGQIDVCSFDQFEDVNIP